MLHKEQSEYEGRDAGVDLPYRVPYFSRYGPLNVIAVTIMYVFLVLLKMGVRNRYIFKDDLKKAPKSLEGRLTDSSPVDGLYLSSVVASKALSVSEVSVEGSKLPAKSVFLHLGQNKKTQTWLWEMANPLHATPYPY
jgi:hypothetical protein